MTSAVGGVDGAGVVPGLGLGYHVPLSPDLGDMAQMGVSGPQLSPSSAILLSDSETIPVDID